MLSDLSDYGRPVTWKEVARVGGFPNDTSVMGRIVNKRTVSLDWDIQIARRVEIPKGWTLVGPDPMGRAASIFAMTRWAWLVRLYYKPPRLRFLLLVYNVGIRLATWARRKAEG